MIGWVAVTGATSGIGLAATERFCKNGYGVLALARRTDRLGALQERLGADLVVPATADVREPDAVRAAVDAMIDQHGAPLALVANAGLSLGFGDFGDGRAQDWDTMLDTNIRGLMHSVSAVLPSMRAAGRGHVITLGSIAARYPYFGGNVYGASKAFVHHLSLNLAVDLQGSGVRVTCVAPGMTKTEFATVRFEGDTDKADAFYSDIVTLTAEDVADAVFWAFSTPQHVTVTYIELKPTDQPFGLSLSRPTGTSATARAETAKESS